MGGDDGCTGDEAAIKIGASNCLIICKKGSHASFCDMDFFNDFFIKTWVHRGHKRNKALFPRSSF